MVKFAAIWSLEYSLAHHSKGEKKTQLSVVVHLKLIKIWCLKTWYNAEYQYQKTAGGFLFDSSKRITIIRKRNNVKFRKCSMPLTNYKIKSGKGGLKCLVLIFCQHSAALPFIHSSFPFPFGNVIRVCEMLYS